MANSKTFDQLVSEAEKQPFTGWDFSYLDGRYHQDKVSWDLRAKLLERIRKVDAMLDMGTGGGEFLATLTPLPKNTYATESYVPNVPIAKKKLEPLGVKVVKTDSDENLPFDDEKFELVMNRHEAFSATEVYRVLRPSGCFITQQVGRKNNVELNKLLQKKLHGKIEYGYQNWDLDSARQTLVASGFRVSESKEEFPETEFYDVAAVIYYLKAIPWQIPDFSVQRYHIQLKEIHDSIEKDGKLKTTAHRFYVVAHKK